MTLVPQRKSLASQTCAVLREYLAAGEWQGVMPGERELCHRMQVSRVTLRAALAQLQSDGVLRSSQGRRREIVSVPGPAQKQLAARAGVILLSAVAHAGLTASKLLWLDELREQLAARGMPLEFIVSGAATSTRPARLLKEVTARHPGAAWVLLRSSAAMQRWFADQKLPTVIAGSRHQGNDLPCVDIDYFAVCRHAAGSLLARGCRRLGLVMTRNMLAGDIDSEAGFRAGAGEHAVAVCCHDGTPDGLGRALGEFMKNESECPDGLLVEHGTHAVSVLGHLLRLGWQVPQQVKLISRDDDPFLEHVVPVPARYVMDASLYARHISRTLFRSLDGEGRPAQPDLLIPKFVSGGTMR